MVRFKGKDQIEFGHRPYDEANFATIPGSPVTFYRIGYVTELRPSFDPELNRVFVLRDSDQGKPLGIYSRRENVGLGITNPRQVTSIPITDEMWKVIEAKAAEVGMDPMEYFDQQIEKANREAGFDE